MKELAESENLTVSALANARLGSKSTIGETRAQRMLDMDTRGAMCVYLKYAGAHTTRWSGGDLMNWQNFTKGSDLRLSIKAPDGYRIVVGDCSQIECRILNQIAGQSDVLQAFREGRDLYSEGASRFYGRTITKSDKLERHLGKTLELGCGFGMGWAKFQTTCRRGALGGPPIILSDDEAKRAVSSYRKSHNLVKMLWSYGDSVLAGLVNPAFQMEWIPGVLYVRNQRVWLPNKTFLDYTHLRYDDDTGEFHTTTRKGNQKCYGALLVENVVQALARVVLSQAMLKVAPHYRIVLCTHDDVCCIVPEAQAEEATAFVLETLRTPPLWMPTIPLDAEGGHDTIYSK
jgi:DNA polymerase